MGVLCPLFIYFIRMILLWSFDVEKHLRHLLSAALFPRLNGIVQRSGTLKYKYNLYYTYSK